MSSSSSSLMGILALLTVILLLTLVGLQVAEYLYYQAEPTIWPPA
jgi:hypothetical protein